MEYQVIRSDRRTVSLQISPDGILIVKCPMSLSTASIEDILKKHTRWIENAKKSVQEQKEKKQARQDFEASECFILGKSIPIRWTNSQTISFDGAQFSVRREHMKQDIFFLLTRQARHYLPAKLYPWAQKIGQFPQTIKITSAKKRWGSCSGGKGICFSFFTMMLPPELIDYIVVHELTHLSEMNHSKKFWDKVAIVMPDYKERESLIKIWEQKLRDAGWYDAEKKGEEDLANTQRS